MAAVLVVLTVGLAGCSPTTPFTAASPAAQFPDSTCLPALGKLRDVVPRTRHSDRLVDLHLTPTTALVCEYGSIFSQGPGPRHSLAQQITLPAEPAGKLASAAARIDVGISNGSGSCPNNTGRVTVIVVTYTKGPSAELWWNTTGCQTIDNGALTAEQTANASFGDFETVFSRLTRTS